MSRWPRVAIVILNWNGVQHTLACLRSLKRITYPNYEIIVVDNASQGDDVAILRQASGGGIRIIENDRNYGFAGGANIGIRQALERGAEFVLLLNNDTMVDPAFLTELVQAFHRLPQAAAVCPKIYHWDRPGVIQSTGGRVSLWRGRARQVGRDEPDQGQYDHPAERDYAEGACMLLSREALEQIGLLDEEYFAYWEEADWCARARGLGFRCYYVPTAVIWHRGVESSTASPRYRYLFRRNAFLFLRKRGRPYHLLTAALYHLLVLGPWFLLRHPLGLPRLAVEAKALLWHLARRVPPGP